jgi:hypothetical protein
MDRASEGGDGTDIEGEPESSALIRHPVCSATQNHTRAIIHPHIGERP